MSSKDYWNKNLLLINWKDITCRSAKMGKIIFLYNFFLNCQLLLKILIYLNLIQISLISFINKGKWFYDEK